MKDLLKVAALLLVFSSFSSAAPKTTVIDDFEDLSGWNKIASDKAELDTSAVPGQKGKAINMKFSIPGGAGYVVIGKEKEFQLPDNYRFSFYIKGKCPENTMEFKVIDKEGNTFWKKLPDFSFPDKWTEIIIKKSDLVFAWGPNQGNTLKNAAKIELAVSAGQGGKGDVAFDNLVLTEIEETATKFNMKATASTFENAELAPDKTIDKSMTSRWSSNFVDNQWLLLDIGKEEELVGLTITWETAFGKEYKVLISKDNVSWTEVFATTEGDGETDDIMFPRQKARYIKLDLIKRGTGYGFSIYEIKLKGKDQEILLSASSSAAGTNPGMALDGNKATAWQSGSGTAQYLTLDFQKPREIGGLTMYWGNDFSSEYNILGSNNNTAWTKLYAAQEGNGARDRIYLKNPAYRYIRLDMLKSGSSKAAYSVQEIEVTNPENAATPQKLYEIAAEEKPVGYYPKYFLNKQTYWTLIGVNSDQKEALLNQEGLLEVDAERFSLEPFIYSDGKFFNWGNVKLEQKLEKNYLPIPSVNWNTGKLDMTEKVFADGEPGKSTIVAWYRVKNNSTAQATGKFYVAARPFQVDPPWQCLFSKGGLAKISTLNYDGRLLSVNNEKSVIPLTSPDNFGAAPQAAGDITKFISKGLLPEGKNITDPAQHASGAFEYNFNLAPGETKDVYIAVPFHFVQPEYRANMPPAEAANFVTKKLDANIKYWDSKISTFDITVPGDDMRWINTMKTYLAYILINKDGPATKPGSRSYNRSWIRDGSMTCSSLLKMGMRDEIKAYADWYSQFIFDYGRVPCNIIGDNQAEGFPENDSNGQYIYLFMQYYNYTKDAAFLQKHSNSIIKAADYIITQRNERKQPKYAGTYFWGLVPESASHEGYCDKFMHSYWDDFFALKGLKDAAKIMEVIGRKDLAKKYSDEVPDFRNSILNSIKLTMKEHKITYIPGCAEKGDFDATSTSIGIYPCDEYEFLPKTELKATFDKYYEFMEKRFIPGYDWGPNYTPYEVRNIRSFIYLDQKDRAHKITESFFNDMRPADWNFWPEVVWRDIDIPRFIGDMPHTWVGADYISSMRSLFVIEDENTNSIIFCKGLKDKWLEDPAGVTVKNLPTIWGIVNYSVKKKGAAVAFNVSGDLRVPGRIILASPLGKPIKSVTVNGTEWKDFTAKEIKLKKIPSAVTINY